MKRKDRLHHEIEIRYEQVVHLGFHVDSGLDWMVDRMQSWIDDWLCA